MKKTVLILLLFLLLFSFSSLAQILGDFNHDGKVDFEDLMIFALAYGSTPSSSHWNASCDLHPDSKIDFEDLMIFAMNYGKTGEWDSLSGIVTNDAGGPPVEGSTIKVIDIEENEVVAETTTDASGKYDFKNIPDGHYDILATKEGRASSKIQNVKIEANKTTRADIIHFQKNVPGWECVPPTITVTGIEDGGTYSGIINYNVSIQDDSDIKYFFIGTGYIPNEYLNDFDGSPGSMYINTPYFLNGEHKIYFVAYDMNYNRSQLCITIKTNNESTGSKPDAPTDVWPLSFTLGKNIGIFSIERDNPISSNSTKKGLEPLNIPGKNKNIDLNAIIKAAPADSNIYVRVTWNEVDDVDGYKIYRRFEGEQNYKYIGDAPWNTTKYHDLSPELAVGKKVWYQVSAYNSYGESDRSDEEWTAPLPKFNVNLVSPVNGATGVSLTPTLQWQPEGIVGNKQRYGVCLIGKNDEDYIYSPEDPYYIWNDTSFTITEPLQPLKIYEWNIWSAFAYDYDDSIGRDRARSIAGSGHGALNGAFQFTTGTGQ